MSEFLRILNAVIAGVGSIACCTIAVILFTNPKADLIDYISSGFFLIFCVLFGIIAVLLADEG